MELKWRNDGHKWAVIEVIAEKKPKKWDDDGIENCETYMQITVQGAQICGIQSTMHRILLVQFTFLPEKREIGCFYIVCNFRIPKEEVDEIVHFEHNEHEVCTKI